MPWDPEKYNSFKQERYQPFFDLIDHIHERQAMKILDLGCGTGELTGILADKFPGSEILGIDSSTEMLADAPIREGLEFNLTSIEEQITKKEKWDLILANASLQWVDEHQKIFQQIIASLNEGGQLAVQMPSQNENALNQLMFGLVSEEPFASSLDHWKKFSPVLSMDDYTRILFDHHAKDICIYQKIYPVIASSHQVLFDFISGSALIPYMERFDETIKEQFKKIYMDRIRQKFPKLPAVYAFRRLIIYASF